MPLIVSYLSIWISHNYSVFITVGGYPATQTIKGIVKIVLQFGDIIDGFEVSYKLNDGSVKRVHHGTTPPTRFKIKTRTITFECEVSPTIWLADANFPMAQQLRSLPLFLADGLTAL